MIIIIRQAGVFGTATRSILSSQRILVGEKAFFCSSPRGKKRSPPLWEIAYAGCRPVVRNRERKPAREKDKENHLRCTCCAGGFFGPVLKVYQTLSGSLRSSVRRASVAPPRPPPRPPPPIHSSTEYLMALRTIIALQPSFVFRL